LLKFAYKIFDIKIFTALKCVGIKIFESFLLFIL